MGFHGDYELQFEIYKTKDGADQFELLGHMVGIDEEDARIRWAQAHYLSLEEEVAIVAVCPAER